MPELRREQEREDEENGQDDQLDPSRDLDRRAGAGHARDRTAEVRALGGDLATVRTWRLRATRHAARLRADRRRAQARARRFAVAAVIAVLAVATLALTAFDGESSPPAVSRPAPLPVTSAPPDSQVLATVGNLRVQSPVAQGGVTAIGFHGSAEGALELKPVGPQRNEGLLARLWRRITGASKSGLAWYQLSGGALRTLDVGAVAGTDVYAPVDGTVVAIRDQIVSGNVVGSEIELRPSSGALARRLDPERSPRPRAHGRWKRRSRRLEARRRDEHQPLRAPGARALRRRGRKQRRDPGLPVGDPRRALGSSRSAHPLHRRRRWSPGTAGARAAPAGDSERARDRRVRGQRRERRGRHRDHSAPRRSAPRHGRRRDHARQPRVPADRDRPVPRGIGSRHPARRTRLVRLRDAGSWSSPPRTARDSP